MLEQRQFAIYGRTGHLLAASKFEDVDLGVRDVVQLPLAPKKLLQRLEQLLVSQPGTLVRLRIFHVAVGKTLQAYPYGFAVDAPQDFGFPKRMESFCVAPDGAVRRLLDSPSVLIVIRNPPNTFSSVDSHCGSLSTLCQPRAHFIKRAPSARL